VELAEPLDDLAHALQKLGRTDEASKAMERSVALQRKFKM
jgi:Flp pilus assembly protein TadD